MKKMLKLACILALYTAATCVGLAFVYSSTKKIIAERQQETLELALKELFSDPDVHFEDIAGSISSSEPKVRFESQYEAKKNGALIGVAIGASIDGYSGPINILVGIGEDGKLTRIKILGQQETPGLGANASSSTYYVDKPSKVTFYGQFAGKSLRDPFEVKRDVVAITASTITSRAVTLAVKTSGAAGAAWLKERGGAQ